MDEEISRHHIYQIDLEEERIHFVKMRLNASNSEILSHFAKRSLHKVQASFIYTINQFTKPQIFLLGNLQRLLPIPLVCSSQTDRNVQLAHLKVRHS